MKKLLYVERLQQPGCDNGQYPRYGIRDENGNVLQSGITCRCHKGCSNTDFVAYDDVEWVGDLE